MRHEPLTNGRQPLRAGPVLATAAALLLLYLIEPHKQGQPATHFRYNEKDHCGRFHPAVTNDEMQRNINSVVQQRWCGQFGQDRVIASLLNATTKAIRGTFVDLAANDAIRNSNTYALEQLLGWHGLCIEPNPKYHPGFEAYRRCALAKTCVTAEKREVEFALAGGKGHITSSGGAKKSLKLTCEPLSTLLAHHKMRAITYLSLDVEGGELDALRGVDWNTTTIDVLTVETASAELTAFLEGKGFARVFCVALDSVFVAARLKKKATDWYRRQGRFMEPLCISDDLGKCSAGTLLEQCSAACTRTRCVKTG
jgi:FkbM family methyltransferase